MVRARQKPSEPDGDRRTAVLRKKIHDAQTDHSQSSTQTPPLPSFTKFMDLPEELQRRIFELAYRLCPEDPVHWSYISRPVREWIEPMIYDDCKFFMSRYRGLGEYERTFESKPKEFYTKHVRRIYISPDMWGNDYFELKLLPICDNLTSLECWSKPSKELTEILKTFSWPRLKVLCLNVDLLPKDVNIFCLPLFQPVTRLDIQSQQPELPSWKSLESLTNLTHMRVDMLDELDDDLPEIAVDKIIAIASGAQAHFLPSLKYFVIIIPLQLLYCIFVASQGEGNGHRWQILEGIRVGTFDSRIMLGTSGNWEGWREDRGDSGIDYDHAFAMLHYMQLMPGLYCPSWPRIHLDEGDTWEEVERIACSRKGLASEAS